jgi:toxin ParE1/3/4
VGSYRTAKAARDDLEAIRAYTKQRFGAGAARSYLLGLRSLFDLIVDQPRMGAAAASVAEGLRHFSFRSHRIYYRIEGADVVIVRVLHHAQDERSAFRGPE